MYESRLFIACTKVISILVFLYAFAVHTTLIIVLAAYEPAQLETYIGSLPFPLLYTIAGLHIFVCLVGPAVALTFINHAIKNRGISRLGKVLWVMALAAGYGLIFYWFQHIRIHSISSSAKSV